MTILNQINLLTWHPVRRWSVRDLTSINRIIIHQELGEANVEAVNRYHLKPNHISKRGCPHFCYHYGIEKNGEIIQVNELYHITWHTTGQNDTGIGIMLVGDFAGPGHETGTSEPSPEQMNSLGELCDYLMNVDPAVDTLHVETLHVETLHARSQQQFSNQDIYGHYHFGKRACPGYVVQNWIENKRKN